MGHLTGAFRTSDKLEERISIKLPALKDLRNVIWLQTGYLGDIILNTGAVTLLAMKHPDIKQYFITTKIGQNALADMPEIESLFVFTKRGRSSIGSFKDIKAKMREQGFTSHNTLILQPHRSYRSSFLVKYLNLPSITYYETSLALMATRLIDRVAVFHEVMRIALLLEPLGIAREDIYTALPRLTPLTLNPSAPLSQIFDKFDGKIVAIACGSNWKTKKWNIEKFCELTKRLLSNPDLGIILLGAQKEVIDGKTIEDYVGTKERLWNLIGKTNLDDLRRIYPKLKLLITNDSSPIHYASAFNIPTIAIFGPTTPSMGFGPLAHGSSVVEIERLTCRPCSAHGPNSCPQRHFNCMEKITIDQVYDLCISTLRLPSGHQIKPLLGSD